MTNIEWVKNPDGTQGITLNPITGCLNHTPEGLCLDGLFPCYAWKLAHTRLKQRYLANKNMVSEAKDSNGICWVGACTGSLKEMLALGLKDEFPDKRVLRWGNRWTLQPRIEWVREVVEAADKAGVKVFLKDNLWPLFDGSKYAVPLWAFDKDSKLRQELPE